MFFIPSAFFERQLSYTKSCVNEADFAIYEWQILDFPRKNRLFCLKNLVHSKKSSTFAVAFVISRLPCFCSMCASVRKIISRSRAVVARQAHNLKVGGSIPPSATKITASCFGSKLFCALSPSPPTSAYSKMRSLRYLFQRKTVALCFQNVRYFVC